MINLEDIIRGVHTTRSLLSDDELRRLPHKKARVYGRSSSQRQVEESKESIREIAKLVMLAKNDGYKTNLEPAQVEKWLESIQSGANVSRIIEDGDVIIDCRDLGLSGSLGEDKRPGLADLWRRVESGEVGAIYLTEGMSRLSRDRDRVLGYKLIKLLKDKQCRVRTPEGIFNPAIPRDWDHLAEDVDDSADEMKKLGIRLGRRRAQKAAKGEHVGSPITPGYIVTIEGRNRDESLILGKWELYPPHQKVVIEALEEIVRQRSLYRAFQALWERHLVFPFFPEELKYMETRSALRFYHKDSTGYLITYNALKGLATNVKLIGIWQWRDVLIENNHDPVVPVDLFLQAYEIATSSKPKGRAAYAEPMEWAGKLYCYDHDETRRIRALNRERRWACRSTVSAPGEAPCLQIADHMLNPPLTRAFLDCLDLTPHAEAVLEKLKTGVNQEDLEESQRRKEIKMHETRLANLERYLGTSDDPEREAAYWRLIDEEKEKLNLLRRRPLRPKATPVDLEKVSRFLENLESEWVKYPSRLRQQLIDLLIDRVELRHDASQIVATVCWRVGLRQTVKITRPATNFAKEKLWRAEEEGLLRVLWPSSSREAILAAFPDRSWRAIAGRAGRLGIKREWVRTTIQKIRLWTNEEKAKLRELYSSEASVADIAQKLERNQGTVITMAHVMGLSRPRELRWRRREPISENITTKLFQESSLPL